MLVREILSDGRERRELKSEESEESEERKERKERKTQHPSYSLWRPLLLNTSVDLLYPANVASVCFFPTQFNRSDPYFTSATPLLTRYGQLRSFPPWQTRAGSRQQSFLEQSALQAAAEWANGGQFRWCIQSRTIQRPEPLPQPRDQSSRGVLHEAYGKVNGRG